MTSGVVASTFDRFGALTSDIAQQGLIAGSSLMFGAFIAKRFVLRLEADMFRLVMDGIMLAAGLTMLANAFLDRANKLGLVWGCKFLHRKAYVSKRIAKKSASQGHQESEARFIRR
jgi:hypothetical protein